MKIAERNEQSNDYDYNAFIQRINERFNTLTGPIFETDAEGLYAAYLASFSEGEQRQYHTCSCCKQFIEHFGSLAVVDDAGHIRSAIWDADDAPEHYADAVSAMARLVQRANLTKPFISDERQYGTAKSTVPTTGHIWTHFAIKPDASRIYKGPITVSAFAAASAKREEFGSVCHALGEYSKDTVAIALKLLTDDQVANSAAVLGQARFLADLHAIKATAVGSNLRSNLIYRAVAVAPSGFCHPRSSMIATLLDDIASGKTFEQAQRAWNAKMHPLAYQRPQAAPTSGAIAQAEKLFAELGLTPALKRRIARLDEIPKLWEPKKENEPEANGVFGHLTPKGNKSVESMTAPAISITLDKFVRTVVGGAAKIEIHLGNTANFLSVTTSEVEDAPKLLQWDHSFAWYVWNGGSTPTQYGLKTGWAEIAAVTRLPSRWGDEAEQKFIHHGDGLIFMVEGARETRVAGAALFPSLLRSELREVRSVIENYSNTAKMQGLADGSAIGIDIRQSGASYPVTVRVTSATGQQTYKIDRWD